MDTNKRLRIFYRKDGKVGKVRQSKKRHRICMECKSRSRGCGREQKNIPSMATRPEIFCRRQTRSAPLPPSRPRDRHSSAGATAGSRPSCKISPLLALRSPILRPIRAYGPEGRIQRRVHRGHRDRKEKDGRTRLLGESDRLEFCSFCQFCLRIFPTILQQRTGLCRRRTLGMPSLRRYQPT